MAHRRFLPLAATVLLLGACADTPTGVSPSAPALFSEEQVYASALLDPALSGCTRQQDNSYSCQWSVSDFQNIHAGAQILVSQYMVFGAEYVCANPKRLNARPKAGGTTTQQITGNSWYTDYSGTITGQATLTPTLPKYLCKGSFVPRISAFYPISAGINVNQVYEEDGNTVYSNLGAETFTHTGVIDVLTRDLEGDLETISVEVFGGGSQTFGVHPDVVIVGDPGAVVPGAPAIITYYGGSIIKIELL